MFLVGGLVIYLIILALIGSAVNALMLPVFGRRFRLFVAPGVILHELAHALACILVGAHVLEINFWKPSGGHVVHTQPKLQIIGPVLISLAPSLFMTLGLFLFAPAYPGLPYVTWTQAVPQSVGALFGGYLSGIGDTIINLNWFTFAPWLMIYLFLNLAVTITPSHTDLANSKWALLALALFIIFITKLINIEIPLDYFWPPIATSLIYLGLALVAAGLLSIIFRSKRH